MNKASEKQADAIDYAEVIKKFPWLVKQNENCILSPDSDGLLCGLFASHYLNWKIRGFYDGKVMVLENGFKAKDCIFLDMEIFRKEVRSVGQHMVLFNKKRIPQNWSNFDDCLSANNIRGYDAKQTFPQKYPLATIHLLLGVVGHVKKIDITTSAICPLLYTDGTFKNLFNYPDNCLSWLKFLKADDADSSLHKVFFNDHYSISSLMLALKDFFAELRSIAEGKRGGDKIKFSNTKGQLINFDEQKGQFNPHTINRAEAFLSLLSEKTGWIYNKKNWSWNNLSHSVFRKGTIVPSQGRYDDLMSKNPLSLAMTSSLAIEYTIDPDSIF
jgi:hypothetical protein